MSVTVEALTSAVLFIAPSWMAQLLVGAALSPSGKAIARLCACALLSLALACWRSPRSDDTTAPALRGMLTYNAVVALYLGVLGVRGTTVGPLLLPAVVFHGAVSLLLAAVAVRMMRGGHVPSTPRASGVA